MRILSTLFFVTFLAFNSLSQSFSLLDLKNMVKMKEKNFIEFVRRKGFTLEDTTSKTAVYKQNNIVEKSISRFSTLFDESVGVSFKTSNLNDFSEIVNLIKQMNLKERVYNGKSQVRGREDGVKFKEKESYTTYSMDEYEVTLSRYVSKNKVVFPFEITVSLDSGVEL
jgi:hypothetical protein